MAMPMHAWRLCAFRLFKFGCAMALGVAFAASIPAHAKPVGHIDQGQWAAKKVIVKKTITNQTGSTLSFGPLAFGIQLTCTPHLLVPSPMNLTLTTPATSSLVMGASISAPAVTVQNVPGNDQCFVNETVVPPVPSDAVRACTSIGGNAIWDTSITQTPGANVLTVSNTLRCRPGPNMGSLTVTKVVVGPMNPQTTTAFPISVTCISGTSVQTGSFALADGQTSAPVTMIPVGAVCNGSETPQPPFVNALSLATCAPPGAFVWAWPPAVSPPLPLIANGGAQSITVTNTYGCTPLPVGSLQIIKTADWDGNVLANYPVTANIQVTCTSGFTTVVHFNLDHNGSFPQTVTPLTVGDVCTITELAPTYTGASATFWPNVLNQCSWHVTFPFGQTVTIAAGLQTLQVVNEEICTGGGTTAANVTVQVQKTPIVNGFVDFTPGVPFQIHTLCGSQNMSWTAQTGSTFGSHVTVPANSTCQWAEPVPPLPPGASNCVWQTKYFYNGVQIYNTPGQPVGSPITIVPPTSGTSNWLNIQNQLVCNGQQVTIPPITGRLSSGGKGVATPPLCAPPLVFDNKRGSCKCPEGTKMERGKCVKKSSFFDDLLGHVSIGVGVGMGSGGGGGGSKPKN